MQALHADICALCAACMSHNPGVLQPADTQCSPLQLWEAASFCVAQLVTIARLFAKARVRQAQLLVSRAELLEGVLVRCLAAELGMRVKADLTRAVGGASRASCGVGAAAAQRPGAAAR